jgi:glycyl-tRNA synthetase beta chain
MNHIADFILEICMEELPIYDQEDLTVNLEQNLLLQFTEHALTFSEIMLFSSPRRIALIVTNLNRTSAAQIVNKRGPLVTEDTKAANSFAASLKVSLNELTTLNTEKGNYWYYEQKIAGIDSLTLLPEIIKKAVDKLNVKKRMRWANENKGFVRPVHWILAKHGPDIIPVTLFNVSANTYTYGHRFHSKQPLLLEKISDYAKLLLEHKVISNRATRRETIKQQILKIAAHEQAIAVLDENLLDIVTNLTEFPVVLCAKFNPDFLIVPKECLISAMQQHQKCFALVDQHGKLLPKFLLVSNIQSTNPATVISGNEIVMNARLHDAAFHFNCDKLKTLESQIPKLKDIAFDQKLGSIFDKLIRMQIIASNIAQQLQIDAKYLEKTSLLCKADLTTNMVNEFPELQGIMGKYYAAFDGCEPVICEAIEQHYWPQHANDQIPHNMLAICLGLADRLDTLAGLFSVGKAPTGEKDPYGLRRQALAVMRIITERQLPLDLRQLFTIAVDNFKLGTNYELINTLNAFCFERLKNLLIKEEFANINEITAVLHDNFTKPYDFILRLKAIVEFKNIPQAASLAAANKRVKNMLNKTADFNNAAINPQVLTLDAEKHLYAQIIDIQEKIKPLLKQQDYTKTLIKLAELKDSIDKFFDDVLINVEDLMQKNNRLALLKMIRDLFLEIADISAL